MNDFSGKRHLPLRGPVLAAMLFALAYGSVMILVIAPRTLLGGAQGGAAESGISAAGDTITEHPQLLRAGFSPLPGDRTTYGIAD